MVILGRFEGIPYQVVKGHGRGMVVMSIAVSPHVHHGSNQEPCDGKGYLFPSM